LALDDGHKSIVIGQVLHDMFRQELWRFYAESWREFTNDVGIGPGSEFARRKNYEFYILELKMDISDPRLSATPESKLAVGTRSRFKPWVRENLDDFLDLAGNPIGEGGLTRADLYKYLEEQVGITDESEDSLTRKALRSYRRATVQTRQLADDAFDILTQSIRNDDDVFDTLARVVEFASAKQSFNAPVPDEEVDLEDW